MCHRDVNFTVPSDIGTCVGLRGTAGHSEVKAGCLTSLSSSTKGEQGTYKPTLIHMARKSGLTLRRMKASSSGE